MQGKRKKCDYYTRSIFLYSRFKLNNFKESEMLCSDHTIDQSIYLNINITLLNKRNACSIVSLQTIFLRVHDVATSVNKMPILIVCDIIE